MSASTFARRFVLVLASLALLRWCDALLVPIAAAAVLALVAAGPVESLQQRGLPAALAAALVVGLPVLGLAGVGAWIATSLPSGAGATAWLDFVRLCERLDASPLHGLRPSVQAAGDAFRQSVGPMLTTASLTAATTLLLLYFVLLAQRSLLEAVSSAMPDRRSRLRLLGVLRESRDGVAGYVGVVTLCNLGLAVATGAGLALAGSTGAAFWCGVVFVLAFVPYVGPALITVLLGAAGAAESGTGIAALGPALWFLALHCVEGNLLSPWLMGRRLRLGRVAVLVAVLVGGWCWGLAGGVLAVPLLVVGHAVMRRTRGARLARALLRPERPAPSWPLRRRATPVETRRLRREPTANDDGPSDPR